jgi:hypothetical protein
MKKILLAAIFLCSFFPFFSHAEINDEIIERYEQVLLKLESKYTMLKFFSVLDRLDERINEYLKK